MSQLRHRLVRSTFTRPADTTQYGAKDVITDATSGMVNRVFSDVVPENGGSGKIISMRFTKDDDDNTASTFRLYLYHIDPTAIADNLAYTLLDADKAKRFAWLDMVAADFIGIGDSDANEAYYKDFVIPFQCAGNNKDLYGVVVNLSTYTPASAEKFQIELGIDKA